MSFPSAGSVSCSPKSQYTFTVVTTMLCWTCNGVTLLPGQLETNFGAFGRFLYNVSYFRFTSRALLIAEFKASAHKPTTHSTLVQGPYLTVFTSTAIIVDTTE
jgi:hypothetical protein